MADLQISKKQISELLSSMQGKKFIIPDYQRPYSWNEEKCETLWEDVVAFSESSNKETEYFLGSVVFFKNAEGNDEIIDGQQRITSLLLLLRAFYSKLQNMTENDEVLGLKQQIEPCIWDVSKITKKVNDFAEFRLKSEVANKYEQEVLHSILEKGEVSSNYNDNYSKNYQFFLNKCNEYAKDNPMQWYELCVAFLTECIVLPIECSSLDSALTIFSTLNNRGMPLEDADIFKAQIYRNYQTQEEKNDFINQWKNLDEICKSANLEINDIFRYYSHIIRARNGDTSKEIGLRTFYSQEKSKFLKGNELLSELTKLAQFWLLVNNASREGDEKIVNLGYESKKYLHIMKYYPNDYWKYVVSVFFMKNYDKKHSFDNLFSLFIKSITAYFYSKFIKYPTVNQIKTDSFVFCKSIMSEEPLKFTKIYQSDEDFKKDMNGSSWKIGRGLLLLKAYLNPEQREMIDEGFEIEHIFPKKWQDTNYFGWSKEDADILLDTFGNTVVLEKKLNIQAGNGYFLQKKGEYKKSKIQEIISLSKYSKDNWTKEDIGKRQDEFDQTIWDFVNENLV